MGDPRHMDGGGDVSSDAAFDGVVVSAAELTECNVRGNKLDNVSATALAKISAPKGIMLFGIKHGQKEASFHNQGLGPVDAILIANDLLVSTSLTNLS